VTRTCTVCGSDYPSWHEDLGVWACFDCREKYTDDELMFPAQTQEFRDRLDSSEGN